MSSLVLRGLLVCILSVMVMFFSPPLELLGLGRGGE